MVIRKIEGPPRKLELPDAAPAAASVTSVTPVGLGTQDDFTPSAGAGMGDGAGVIGSLGAHSAPPATAPALGARTFEQFTLSLLAWTF